MWNSSIVFEDGIPQGLGQRDGLACRHFGHLYEANGRFTRQQMPDGRIVQKAAHNFRGSFPSKIFSLLPARSERVLAASAG